MILTSAQKESVEQFNQKVDRGEYRIEKKTCLCGQDNFVNVTKHDRYGCWHSVVICKNCGMMMSNPCLTEKAYQTFYSSDEYRKLYEGDNYLELARERYKKAYGKHIFERLLPYLRSRNLSSVLEFGSAGGWNLIPFVRNGFSVTGYDYSPSLVKLGKSIGINLFIGSIENIKGKFDIIILNHVVEHFTIPLSESIQTLVNHLNHDGLIYIAVPNMDNFSLNQFQIAHVYYFSPRTFTYYMRRCGLKLAEFGPAQGIHMYGIFEPSSENSDICSLKSEFSLMLRKIRKTKIKHAIVSILNKVSIKNPVVSFYHRIVSIHKFQYKK